MSSVEPGVSALREQIQLKQTPMCSNEFGDVLTRYLSRRQALKLGLSTLFASITFSGLASAEDEDVAIAPGLFRPLDSPDPWGLQVPEGYSVSVLLRWGDPIIAGAPEFNSSDLRSEHQALQFGYNCDFVGYLPLPRDSQASDRGLLCVSSEFTEPWMMWSGFKGIEDLDHERCAVAMAAHGLNIVEIARDAGDTWRVIRDSALNRRVTAESPIQIAGPAAGHPSLRTSYDASGRICLGTIANCSGGLTPWGTWLQAEEGFMDYFRRSGRARDGAASSVSEAAPTETPRPGSVPYVPPEDRYPIGEASEQGWERFHDRFDLDTEPNEINRFGYIVEIDPYDPASLPVKHTALGRFEHEAAVVTLDREGRAVVYTADDARFEHVYKFVSTEKYRPGEQQHNMNLLDDGILYAARFDEVGRGQWLPLIYGRGPLVATNGFASQADVVIQARRAATLLGATHMDRPEDVEVCSRTGAVYLAFTGNDLRTPGQENAANPRAHNQFGHILELHEENADHSALLFAWSVLILCGPIEAGGEYQGHEDSTVISSPDNLVCDRHGNLWIATDGQPTKVGCSDGIYMIQVSGRERGRPRHFLSAVPDAEVCSPVFTPDARTMFCAIQHPGSKGSATISQFVTTFDSPTSRFPDYSKDVPPRSSVVVITRRDGGEIGT